MSFSIVNHISGHWDLPSYIALPACPISTPCSANYPGFTISSQSPIQKHLFITRSSIRLRELPPSRRTASGSFFSLGEISITATGSLKHYRPSRSVFAFQIAVMLFLLNLRPVGPMRCYGARSSTGSATMSVSRMYPFISYAHSNVGHNVQTQQHGNHTVTVELQSTRSAGSNLRQLDFLCTITVIGISAYYLELRLSVAA